jgi:hypothetical protein
MIRVPACALMIFPEVFGSPRITYMMPETNLPTAAAATDGIAPTTMQDAQYSRQDEMYTDFRPNPSE